MRKVIIVNGYGPGISNAVATRFGREGFAVALVGRNADRLAQGVKSLAALDVKAEAFVADLSKPEMARDVVARVQDKLGPISVVQWTAYSGAAGDLTTAEAHEVRAVYDVAVTSLLAQTQAALPDLRAQKGALLVTNGGLGYFDDAIDKMAVSWNTMGLAVANAAKHKTVRMLAHKLAGEGVYVGEVVVTGMVKGTAFDQGNATLDPKDIAEKFWTLYEARKETSVRI